MFQNGSMYRGDFVEGNFEGFGWYEFDEGYYEGEWKAGQYGKNAHKYSQVWLEFFPHLFSFLITTFFFSSFNPLSTEGYGTLQYLDGGSYIGRFLAGKAHGHGEEKNADGVVRRGEWNHGELVEPS